MALRPSDRISRLPQQVFSGLIQEAQAARDAGHDVINLGQGNPDQPTPGPIVHTLAEHALDPAMQRYIPFSGLFALKEAVADWYHRRHQVEVDPQREVAICIGSKVGLQEISLAVLNAGDRVLMPDPGYPDYWSGVALAGGQLIPWRLRPEYNFTPDLGAIDSDVRLAFLNYPNNPTGRLASSEFLAEAAWRAVKSQTVLVHDLAYGDIVYDGLKAPSLLSTPEGKLAGIEFTTTSKSYNMAGWRIGFAVGNQEIIGWLERLQEHLHCSQFGAIQMAAITALGLDQRYIDATRDTYQKRRDAFIQAASEVGLTVPPSQGSIFLWCPLPHTRSASAWAQLLLSKAHIVTAPGTAFGNHGQGYLRIALTESEERMAEAARRIGAVLN